MVAAKSYCEPIKDYLQVWAEDERQKMVVIIIIVFQKVTLHSMYACKVTIMMYEITLTILLKE